MDGHVTLFFYISDLTIVASSQIGGCISKIMSLFQLAKTQSQLKQFFDTGRVVNTKYRVFSWTNETQLSGKNYASKKKNDNEIHEKLFFDGYKK